MGIATDTKNMTLTVREVDPEMHKEFRHICIDENVSMNEKVKELIAEYVQKYRATKK